MKKRTPKPIQPRRLDERRYHKRVRQFILNPLFTKLVFTFDRADELRGRVIRSIEEDFDSFDLGDIPEREATLQVEALRRAHRKKMLSTFQAALGVSVGGILNDPAIRPVLNLRIRENVGLITSIKGRFQEDLLNSVDKTLVNSGFDQQAMKKVLGERFKVSDNTARLITRDQTNKTIGELTKIRQQQLGIKEYIWRTAGDEDVRDDHAALNGSVQRWDRPPSIGHPGEPIQCRCSASPVIPDDF